MVDMDELVVLATDDAPVRRYLAKLGIRERDITQYVDEARQGRPVTVSLGNMDGGLIPPLRLRCRGGSDFELTSPTS
jgi:hypothetical protein